MEEKAQIPLKCKETGKLLARVSKDGIYLICKECRQEEFYSWEEILAKIYK
jgi:hypothetical protein